MVLAPIFAAFSFPGFGRKPSERKKDQNIFYRTSRFILWPHFMSWPSLMVNNAHIISFSAEESRSAVSTVLYSCKHLEMYLLKLMQNCSHVISLLFVLQYNSTVIVNIFKLTKFEDQIFVPHYFLFRKRN